MLDSVIRGNFWLNYSSHFLLYGRISIASFSPTTASDFEFAFTKG